MRKREGWSKWIPASVGNKSSMIEERSVKQSEEGVHIESLKKDTSGEDHSNTENKSKFSKQDIDKVCDDFGSTFMFDEELELEHKKDDISSKTRYNMTQYLYYVKILCQYFSQTIVTHLNFRIKIFIRTFL